jgi:hypothetical protein
VRYNVQKRGNDLSHETNDTFEDGDERRDYSLTLLRNKNATK